MADFKGFAIWGRVGVSKAGRVERQRPFMPVGANKVSVHGIRAVLIRMLVDYWGGAAITLFSPPAGKPTNRGNHPAEQPAIQPASRPAGQPGSHPTVLSSSK